MLLSLWKLVDAVDCQHSVAAHIRVPVLQACKDGRDEWLKNFLFPYSTEESECDAPYVLIRVLQVVTQILADQDLQQAVISASAWAHEAARTINSAV